jgi:hypothetical protein
LYGLGKGALTPGCAVIVVIKLMKARSEERERSSKLGINESKESGTVIVVMM